MTRSQSPVEHALCRFWRAMRGDPVGQPGPFEVVAFVFGYMTLLITGLALLVYVVGGLIGLGR